MKTIKFTLIFFLLIQVSFAQENSITIKVDQATDTINRNIYGHFAEHLGRCIYGGFFVGDDATIPNKNGIRLDIVDALKELSIPVLRWPGGCFAEQYQWRDGIGPLEDRPKVVNAFWGGVPEDNSFGTHEFLELCEMLDTEAYLAVNIASGTVKDASNWVEYVTSDVDSEVTQLRKKNGRDKPWDVKFWGIGNENWGCGGNMSVDYYTNVFKRYSTYCRADFKIGSGGLPEDFNWTKEFVKNVKDGNTAQGMSYHFYTIVNDWTNKGSSTDFMEDEWFKSMHHTYKMKANLEGHIAVMDKEDPENKIALIADEWGAWYDVEPGTNPGFLYQQNTLRDALVAAIGLNIFNNHARRVKMANIAQTVNVLQAMILTKENKMVKTPSFYVFKMFKVHQDASLLPSVVSGSSYKVGADEIPSLSVSASKNKEGDINISIANLDPNNAVKTAINLEGLSTLGTISGQIITAKEMNALNDFDKKEEVVISTFKGFKKKKGAIEVTMPAKSVVLITIGSK